MKFTPFLFVPLVFLSCNGPTSSGTTHPSDSAAGTLKAATDSGKRSLDSSNRIARDSSRPANADTPATPMIAKNWIGTWKNEEQFGGGELKITSVTGKTFTFSMEVSDGGASGELEGTARLRGYRALHTSTEYGGTCRIEFTFEGDSIYVDQQQGNCEAGAGVYYSGYYYKHPPKRTGASLISLGMLTTEAQDKKFRALVGDDYKLFVQSSQMVFQEEKDTENLHAIVHRAGVKHEFTSRENIILINDNMDIWAAVINEDSVNYYSNRTDYKHRLPKTIDDWRERFNDKPIVFK